MTQPVQEPTPNRDLSGLGWGERQLARRPAPPAGTATVTIPCLRGLRDYGTGLSVGSASETPVTFDQWENEDNTIFGETLFSGNLQKVKFLQQGVYTVTITISWESQFDGVTEVAWLDDSTTGSNWPFGQSPNHGQFGSGRTADSFSYPLTMSITKKFPRYLTTAGDVSGGIYGQVFTKVIQRSGVNQDLTWVGLDVYYLGATLTSL